MQSQQFQLWAAEICSSRYRELFQSYTAKKQSHLKMKAGIEIEGIVSHQIGLKGIANAIYKYILRIDRKTILTELETDQKGHPHYEISYTNKSGKIKTWNIKEDFSVETYEVPLEITSPILEVGEDFELFKKLVKMIEKTGGKIAPSTGGIHVHVDFEGAEAGEMATLAAIFSQIETELKELFSSHPRRADSIASTSPQLLEVLKNKSFTKDAPYLINHLLKSQDRNHALNLHSYRVFNTVEFRLFNSTLNIDALTLMHDFAMKLVQGVRTQNPKLVAYLIQNNGKIEVEGIAKALNMKLAQPEAKKVLKLIFNECMKSENKHTYLSKTAVLLASSYWINSLIEQMKPLQDS